MYMICMKTQHYMYNTLHCVWRHMGIFVSASYYSGQSHFLDITLCKGSCLTIVEYTHRVITTLPFWMDISLNNGYSELEMHSLH